MCLVSGRTGYEVDSDGDSMSTGTSEGSTPVMGRRGRKASAGSEESAESGSSSNMFKVTTSASQI